MTSTAANIRWSDLELTTRDFVDDYRDSLPVVLITRTGYSGYDEDIHQIGAGEIYWVYEIQRQKRLVARQESENKFLSIPSDYPLNVQVIMNGKLGPAKSVKDLSKQLMGSVDPIEIQFENNQSVSFQIGADIANATQFGTLSIEDTYEEKYLLAYTIHGGEIFSKTLGLPVYMDITVSVAEGLSFGDTSTFDTWIEELKKVAGRFTSTPAKMCREIILFNQMPSSGQYEYLKPEQFANLQQQPPPLIDGKPTPGGKPGDQQKLNVYVSSPEKPAIQKAAKLSLPPFPRRPPPSLPGQVGPSGSPASSPTIVVPEMFKKPGGTKQTQNAPPALPPNRITSIRLPPHPPSGKEQKCIKVKPGRTALSNPAPDPLLSQAQGQRPHPGPSVHEPPLIGPAAACSFDAYKTFEEIPANIDVSGLSVGQISRTLSLMKLGCHCSVFESRHVDGELLLQLNEDILVKDFGFSSFDAKKLMMFTKGWRPKKS